MIEMHKQFPENKFGGCAWISDERFTVMGLVVFGFGECVIGNKHVFQLFNWENMSTNTR